MRGHKEIYWDYFDYMPGDVILCEISGKVAVDVHAIENDKRGGKKTEARIEDLIALTREIHTKNGDSKKYKAAYYRAHLATLERQMRSFDRQYILNQIDKYSCQ